jgi:hypothetical protein
VTDQTDRLIRAPWTSKQVDALNRFQQHGGMHPFTCGNDQHNVSVVLMAHRDGWHCSDPACGYRQDWAHAFMADRAGAVSSAGPAPAAANLAEDLRYVLNYSGPGHAHERPGVWDTSGKPCTHCARLAVARRNLAAYDAKAAAVLPAPDQRAAECPECDDTGACNDGPCPLRRLAGEAQQDEARRCVCGEPDAPSTMHRADGPCYVDEDTPAREAQQDPTQDVSPEVRAAIRAEAFREAAEAVSGMDTDPGTQFAAEHLHHMATVARPGQPETGKEASPVCQGFVWIGQSFTTCDRCAQPAWEHDGEEVPSEDAGPFDTRRTVRPWKPGEADAIRAKWAARTGEQPC